MKKTIIILAILAMIATPTVTHAGWFGDLFSKKTTTVEQKNNNSINSKVSNNTSIGATTVEGAKNTVNIPKDQTFYDGNFSTNFAPFFFKQNELSQAETDTIKALTDNQNTNNKSLLDKANNISESAIKNGKENTDNIIKGNTTNTDTITKPITEISNTLKDPPALKLHSETQSFIQSLRQDLITPLQNIASKIELVGSTLTDNNTALVSVITNIMPFPSGGSSGTNFVSSSITQTAHGLVAFNWVYLTTGGLYTKAINTNSATSETIGMVTTVTDANTIKITFDGYVTGMSGLTIGTRYYLSGTTAGAMTTTVPTTGIVRPIFIADTATSGYIQQYTSGESLPGTIAQVFASSTVTPSASQIAASTSVLIPGMTTTLTPNGTTRYLVLTSVRARSQTTASNNSVDGGIQAALFDSTAPTVALSNSEILPVYNANANTISLNSVTEQIQATSGGSYILTLSSPMTLQVRAWNLAAATTGTVMADNNGRTSMTIIQLDNKLPVSGQTVDYVNITTGAIQTVTGNQTVNTATSAVTFLTPTVEGNIPVNTTTGKITLTAGKTYTLSAKVPSFTTGVLFQWVNATAGTFIGERWDASTSSAGINGNSPIVTITPTTTTDVYVQSVYALSSALGVNDVNGLRGVSVHVQQLGTSAVYAGVYPGIWTSYTPVITSTGGTNPTLPTAATITGNYSIQGKTMFLNIRYNSASLTGGADGTGSYQWSIPAGYTIDTTKASIPSVLTNTAGSGLDGGVVGSGFGRNSTAGNSSGLIIMPLSTTTIGAYFEAATRLMGASSLAATGASNTTYSFVCQIPIN